jgi:predicted Zn-dependent protease
VLWSRDQSVVVNPTERFARQLTLLSKAVEIAPNHPLVIGDLITIALQCADEKDDKVAQLRDVLVQGIAPELSHFIRGTAAMMRDDLDEATVHLELAAKGLPSVPAVLNNLAVALATREDADLDRALRLVDAAIKQIPTQPYFHETRAQIMMKKESYAEAVISFERALPAEALREQVHDGLSKAYASLGQQTLSEQHGRLANAIRESKKVQGPMDDVKVDFSEKK